jgi:cytoskeletal protein RodZ
MGSFGDRLKKEREQRSISLDDISLSTKIGTRLLRALEEEKFDQLPGGIFNKGFVRAYARHVGLDEEQAISDYMAALGESQVKASAEAEVVAKPAPAAEQRRPVPRESRNDQPVTEIPWTSLALLLLLIALAFASWNYYHRDQGNEAGSNSTRVSATGNPPVAPTSPAQGSQPGSSTASTSNQTSASGQPGSTPQGTFTVLLKGNAESEESWVSIVVDGNRPAEAMISAPTQKEIQATKEVIIKAGNVGALDFFFNGKKLPAQGQYGVVKTLTFHPDGLQPSPSRPLTTPAP